MLIEIFTLEITPKPYSFRAGLLFTPCILERYNDTSYARLITTSAAIKSEKRKIETLCVSIRQGQTTALLLVPSPSLPTHPEQQPSSRHSIGSPFRKKSTHVEDVDTPSQAKAQKSFWPSQRSDSNSLVRQHYSGGYHRR